MKTIFHLLILCILCCIGLSTQAQLYPVDLHQRIEEADKVLIGTLSDKICFRSEVDQQIYTLNLIQVQAYLKGSDNQHITAVITPGGEVNGEGRIVFPAVKFQEKQLYLLFLEQDPLAHRFSSFPQLEAYRVYSSLQGTLPFEDGFFKDIFFESLTGREMLHQIFDIGQEEPVSPSGESFYLPQPTNMGQASRMVSITAVSSLTATGMAAGTIDSSRIAVIQGSGFDPFSLGSLGSSIQFSNAQDGGATFIGLDDKDTDVISWSNTEIRVKIPGDAGTGPLRLNIFANTPVTFPITIDWAVIPKYSRDQNWTDTMRQRLELTREGNVSNNGYAFQFDTNFWNNTDAVEAFLRAVQTWRCNTFINLNFVTAANNAVFVSGNGSQVRFSTAATLGVGVLAQSNLRFRTTFSAALPACVRENTLWYITDMDVLFLDNPAPNSWNFNDSPTAAGAYDFESMALKMVGLVSGLGYINQAGSALYFELPLGQDIRNLTANEIVAGTHKVTHSVTNTACKASLASNGLMVPVASGQNCVLSWKQEEGENGLVPEIIPGLSVSEEKLTFSIPASVNFPLQIELFDLQGKRIWEAQWTTAEDIPDVLQVTWLPHGLYTYRFSNETSSWAGKWIK